jgi:chemotaxis protein MotB
MAGEEGVAPIIIKKVKKVSHGGHHGGAWKVAYADFVTAMMAFFLLLWLLNSTTDEQKQGIADYFSPASISKSSSGSGGVMGGHSPQSDSGAMPSDAEDAGVTMPLPDPEADEDAEVDEDLPGQASEERRAEEAKPPEDPEALSEEELRRLLAEKEAEQFAEAEAAIRQALESIPNLDVLSQSLVIDRTEEGLRIQIVDQAGQSMFPLGSAEMYDHTRELMQLVTNAIRALPQQISVKGYTDASPYVSSNGYSNWELSSDRANASRRALIDAGLPSDRVASVSGRADQDLLVPEDPFSPRNRRISITLLREVPVQLGANSGLKAGNRGPAK